MRDLNQCTALLFDGSSADAVSRLYLTARRIWSVQGNEPDAKALLHQCLAAIDDAVRQSSAHVVLALSFEASAAFAVTDGLTWPQPHNATPWLQAIEFDAPQRLNRAQALAWLQQQSAHANTQLTPCTPTITPTDFLERIDAIRTLIGAGDTYQVNYTFPLLSELHAYAQGDAALAAVYLQLVQDLKIPYGAFLTLPHNSVLSFSPELLVEMTADSLICRPMKGTAAMSDNDLENTRRAQNLATDDKNRAENLMIVDLMRNDLSRLPQVERVTVPQLFDVQPYGAVLQMTSTVQADLTQQPSLTALFDALFPCGSITGAPKRRTIEVINALETSPRGTYCGAIGCVEPIANGRAHAVFSVPIRTIETTAHPHISSTGIQHWPLRLSVGAGITYDSDPIEEWHECLLKAQFLTQHTQTFELIETMRVEPDGTIILLAQHMARLSRSAAHFGWEMPSEQQVLNIIDEARGKWTSPEPGLTRLRLSLQPNCALSALATSPEKITQPVQFDLFPNRIDSSNPLLQHKTNARVLYNAALHQAKARGLFDYVFLNEKNEVTEGARSNIFIRQNDTWFTPPLRCGVLAGVQRSVLMTQLAAQEKILRLDDLAQAEEIVLCNALYGALQANQV